MMEPAEELKKLEQELEDTRAALVQSEKMARLSNLIAGVAHEINTPIGSIHSNSDLMVRALEKLQKIVDDTPCSRKIESSAGFSTRSRVSARSIRPRARGSSRSCAA